MKTIGYVRATTSLDGHEQLNALIDAGCTPVFVDGPHGLTIERVGTIGADGHCQPDARWRITLGQLRLGDTLVVTRLDRLGVEFPGRVASVLGRGARVRVLNHPGLCAIPPGEWGAAVSAVTCPKTCAPALPLTPLEAAIGMAQEIAIAEDLLPSGPAN